MIETAGQRPGGVQLPAHLPPLYGGIPMGYPFDVRAIYLPSGEMILVDAEDYDRVVAAGPWHIMRTKTQDRSYAKRNLSRPRARAHCGDPTLLHRFILSAPKGMDVDHRNRDGLDNRKANLRLCTRSQNLRNQAKGAGHTSQFKGVHWDASRGCWHAQIKVGLGVSRFLGRFESEVEAAHAYDVAVAELAGEYARPNFR